MATGDIGRRITRARRRRGLSQAALAGLIGRSESWLSQVERGKRSADSHTVLSRLAEVLRVDISELAPQAPAGQASTKPYPGAALIEQAMTRYTGIGETISRRPHPGQWDTGNLLGRIRAAYHLYQATRYEEASQLLPGLIRDVEAATRTASNASPDLCRARALAYDTTAALLNRVGECALAWLAADRAIAAAEQASDPLLTALGAYRLAYVLPGRKHRQQAIEIAMSAAAALEAAMSRPGPEYLSIYGGLHLAASSAAAAGYDGPLNAALLRKARSIADRLGEDANLMGTAFGPINVAIHTMSASVRLGDARTAIEVGESLDPQAMPPGLTGRRAQIHLDLACAYAMRRQDAAAVNTLLAAERLSPQLVRFDERTAELITALLHREHRASTPELRPLAQRAGVI